MLKPFIKITPKFLFKVQVFFYEHQKIFNEAWARLGDSKA